MTMFRIDFQCARGTVTVSIIFVLDYFLAIGPVGAPDDVYFLLASLRCNFGPAAFFAGDIKI